MDENIKQYIDKAAVVAEIKRRIKEIDEMGTYLSPKGTLTNLLCFLDTLEVKEVNLEKEANEAWDYIFSRGWDENSRMALKHDEYMAFAKHFFELGLNTQKGE